MAAFPKENRISLSFFPFAFSQFATAFFTIPQENGGCMVSCPYLFIFLFFHLHFMEGSGGLMMLPSLLRRVGRE